MNLVTLKNKIKSGVVVGGLLVAIVPNLVSADQVEPHNDPIWNRYGYVTVNESNKSTPVESEKQESSTTNVDAARKAAEDLANYWAHYDWSKQVSSWSTSSTSYNRYGYTMYP